MVAQYQMPAYYRSSPLTVDTSHAQKYFEEEDNGILDDNILDHSTIDSGLEMSPPMANSRRDSFAVSSSLFSPKTEDWQSVDMQSVPSNNPFLEPHHQHHHNNNSNNNPFTRVDQSQAYGAQGQWSLGQASGTCTPLQQYDALSAEYDNASLFQRPLPMQTPFSNPGNQVALFPAVGSQNHSIPTSPQKDWMGQDMKNQSMAKRMRPGSPTIRSHNELRRGDGIRKKNARFDIPAERNLSNIDHLIAQSTDEQEIKELKQQKRLLRNRQAALDSRQRKKMHTERLEDEKKHYTVVISGMEEEIADLNLKLEQMFREKEFYQNQVENLRMEKEDLIANHTIETGELRKKVSVLTDHVQRLESAPMANNNGFSNSFNEMEGMTMDAPWDNMGFMGDFQMEQDDKQEVQIVPTKKQEVNLPSEVDKPSTQGGLLFMLFLVGAFVLSNRSPSTPSIPRVSEDVREASATLLENIFKDAGVAQNPENVMGPAAPQPSGANWASASSVNMHGVAPSMLGHLSDSLTQPTQEQSNEQLFSLTAAQYNGVNSQEFLQNPPTRSTSQGRRNLADALASMRNNDKQSAAEVYTRSLLWDQIPGDVVRNFAKMVADANSHHGADSNS
ncbi:bZIP transcription factor [Pseudomassariella vexata]|uniref:BZIP transcription factor n=1 Tax=Pseudomassariella vexata TaxID=1141098 RepID=A0A1Y2E439_9PEZI|nr:bZIP transcription factor [Pseudomassariella vexata]ORY66292.1 bZIP transcription factor [Pseudomassariella vexata]